MRNVKTYTFVVNTDAGETGTSDTFLIDGIVDLLRITYNAAADAGTNITMRGGVSGTPFLIHSEAANNADKQTAPSVKSPRLVNDACNVYVDSAGGALTAAVTVVAEVLIN